MGAKSRLRTTLPKDPQLPPSLPQLPGAWSFTQDSRCNDSLGLTAWTTGRQLGQLLLWGGSRPSAASGDPLHPTSKTLAPRPQESRPRGWVSYAVPEAPANTYWSPPLGPASPPPKGLCHRPRPLHLSREPRYPSRIRSFFRAPLAPHGTSVSPPERGATSGSPAAVPQRETPSVPLPEGTAENPTSVLETMAAAGEPLTGGPSAWALARDLSPQAGARATGDSHDRVRPWRHAPRRLLPTLRPGPAPYLAFVGRPDRRGGEPKVAPTGSWAAPSVVGPEVQGRKDENCTRAAAQASPSPRESAASRRPGVPRIYSQPTRRSAASTPRSPRAR